MNNIFDSPRTLLRFLQLCTPIYLLIIYQFPSSVCQKPIIHIFHGLQIEEQPHTIFYTESFPLVIKLKGELHTTAFPNTSLSSTLKSGFCYKPSNKNDDKPCKRLNNIRNLTDHINRLLAITQKQFNRYLMPQPFHSKRNFIGNFLSYCCEVATHEELLSQDINIQQAYNNINKLKQLVHNQHYEIVETHRQLNNFTQHVKETLHTFAETLDDFMAYNEHHDVAVTHGINTGDLYMTLFQSTIIQLYMVEYQNYLHFIHSKCNTNNLPSSLISSKELTPYLSRLEAILATNNLQLAIPISDILLYFTLPLTTCIFAQSETVLHLSVPLRPSKMNCKLYKQQTLPLIWKNYVCQLDSSDFYIAACGTTLHYIPFQTQSCNPEKSALCLLRRFHTQTSFSAICLQLILESRPIEDLKKNCPFICTPRTPHAIIHQTHPAHFYVTPGTYNLSILCFENDTTTQEILQSDIYGLLELEIPCHCELHEADRILIRRFNLCDKRTTQTPIINHLLPAMWTKLSDLQLDPVEKAFRPKFKNLTTVLQDDWAYKMPPFTTKMIIDNEIFNPIGKPQSLVDIMTATSTRLYLIFAWCTLLSSFLLYIQCIVIRNLHYRIDVLQLQALSTPSISHPQN